MRKYKIRKEKEWDKLGSDLELLITYEKYISGLAKHIINFLVNNEKRLKKLEAWVDSYYGGSERLDEIKVGGTDPD